MHNFSPNFCKKYNNHDNGTCDILFLMILDTRSIKSTSYSQDIQTCMKYILMTA